MKDLVTKKTIPIYVVVLLLLVGIMLFTRNESVNNSTTTEEETSQSSSYALNEESMEETYVNSQTVLEFELPPEDKIRLHFDSAISAAFLNKEDASIRAQAAIDYINSVENAYEVVTYTDLGAAMDSLGLIVDGQNEKAVETFPPYTDIATTEEPEDIEQPAEEDESSSTEQDNSDEAE